MIEYTPRDFDTDTIILAEKITKNGKWYKSIYPVPRGGVPVAVRLSSLLGIPVDPKALYHDTLVVDDIVDSGKTRCKFEDYDFACLHMKKYTPAVFANPTYYVNIIDDWVEYWWESMSMERPAEDAVTRLIESIGEDPNREGLRETPKRVIKSYEELFAGYKQDPKDVFKTFEDEQVGGLVYLKEIEFYSTCEHHLLPFAGEAFVAYIPNGPVIGVSKLARLLDIFSRRLQIQERIAEQVTGALMDNLNPLGAACLLEARHFCIMCRGVKKQHSIMGYSSLRGAFMEHSHSGVAARNELMTLWKR